MVRKQRFSPVTPCKSLKQIVLSSLIVLFSCFTIEVTSVAREVGGELSKSCNYLRQHSVVLCPCLLRNYPDSRNQQNTERGAFLNYHIHQSDPLNILKNEHKIGFFFGWLEDSHKHLWRYLSGFKYFEIYSLSV